MIIAVYNLIYISPLILMLAICMSVGTEAQNYLIKVRNNVDWSFAHILPPTLGLIGVYLLVRGIWMMGEYNI